MQSTFDKLKFENRFKGFHYEIKLAGKVQQII